MSEVRTLLHIGARVLTDRGTAVVVGVLSSGVRFRDCLGNDELVEWTSLGTVLAIREGMVAALSEPLRPMWDALDDRVKDVAIRRLEAVQEVITGYRDGHRELARPGEPHAPFGPGFGLSESRRCMAMAELLSLEGQSDPELQRRVRDGEVRSSGVNPSTVRNWVRAWKTDGLAALVDGRSVRPTSGWAGIDPQYREVAREVVDSLDGSRSTVSISELDRRIRVQLKDAGISEPVTPQRITAKFLSTLKAARGTTTRSQRSHSLQKVSGTQHYPAMRPGQVVAIDATRADNLVYDPLSGSPFSVEILTAIDVATRVVLALRVVPMSADSIDAGLLLYDVCRPFSLAVEGQAISDFRWVGLPEQIDATSVMVRVGRRLVSPDFTTLQGEHLIPSVMPDAIRSDHGSIFVSEHFRAILQNLGIDLLLSRGKKPTDNPHVERWHETIQRGLQQITGYKGRNTSERGLIVSTEPLLTAAELQTHLRKFIALDYHRTWHTGIAVPHQYDARMCPLELWDAMIEATGRIDVPQRPDLIYQFLPVRWLTIGRNGVELRELAYDSEALDGYREVPEGFFRPQDGAAPFFVDPHDMSRIWFRDPSSKRVEAIDWKGANRLNAPMTQTIVDAVRKRIRDRGGNDVLKRGSATRQILNEITQITKSSSTKEWKAKWSAAGRRVEQSRFDHGEVQSQSGVTTAFQNRESPPREVAQTSLYNRIKGPWPNLLDD